MKARQRGAEFIKPAVRIALATLWDHDVIDHLPIQISAPLCRGAYRRKIIIER